MARRNRTHQPHGPALIVSSFLRNMLLAIGALVGFIAYSSGSGLEGSLLTVIIVLLVFVILGYTADFILWLVQARVTMTPCEEQGAPGAPEIEGHARRVEDAGPQAEPARA